MNYKKFYYKGREFGSPEQMLNFIRHYYGCDVNAMEKYLEGDDEWRKAKEKYINKLNKEL